MKLRLLVFLRSELKRAPATSPVPRRRQPVGLAIVRSALALWYLCCWTICVLVVVPAVKVCNFCKSLSQFGFLVFVCCRADVESSRFAPLSKQGAGNGDTRVSGIGVV